MHHWLCAYFNLVVFACILRLAETVVYREHGEEEATLADPLAASGTALWQSKKHIVLKSAVTDNRTLGSDPRKTKERPPRIYLLFMAADKILNFGIWKKFFAQAHAWQFRAFVHCTKKKCRDQVANTSIEVVKTVPSSYCSDLVTPMQQLVHFALKDDPSSVNSADKFVFVSDSTLPAKPFWEIYSTLTTRAGSDFCVFPFGDWAFVPGSGSGSEMNAKYHQWIVLERAHAEKAWDLWANGADHNFMLRFRTYMEAYTRSESLDEDARYFGCLDEFWYMDALFGTIKNVKADGRDAAHDYPRFTGAPLRASKTAGWQGQCDTLALWLRFLETDGGPFKRFYDSLDNESVPEGGTHRPASWNTISPHGIRAIRSSEFLFARKFSDNPRVATGGVFETVYTSIVLS